MGTLFLFWAAAPRSRFLFPSPRFDTAADIAICAAAAVTLPLEISWIRLFQFPESASRDISRCSISQFLISVGGCTHARYANWLWFDSKPTSVFQQNKSVNQWISESVNQWIGESMNQGSITTGISSILHILLLFLLPNLLLYLLPSYFYLLPDLEIPFHLSPSLLFFLLLQNSTHFHLPTSLFSLSFILVFSFPLSLTYRSLVPNCDSYTRHFLYIFYWTISLRVISIFQSHYSPTSFILGNLF